MNTVTDAARLSADIDDVRRHTRSLRNICRHLAPRARMRSLVWCVLNIFTHEGRPFDGDAYPHLGAPGGPFDAFDDPKVRDIWLQFASRLGKTFFGQCCQLFTAAMNPCAMMFASSVEKLAVEVVSRTYRMIEQCKALKRQLRPPNRRTQDRIDLEACRIYVAWSRSVSTLADKDSKVTHDNEIDKWEHQATSKEGDPLKLSDDRSKAFTNYKRIKEGTPQVKGRSRVEHGRLNSTNCRLEVPCPHCGRYQRLEMGSEDSIHGLKWDRTESGKSDKDHARATARYICKHCHEAILDHHRPQMMRAGVWCPEGCEVDSDAARAVIESLKVRGGDGASLTDGYEWRGWAYASWIIGHPARDGQDAGYQLSSLYALSLTWGDIAAEFVGCKGKPQDLRNFVNQWLGETWEVIQREQSWEQLGNRLIISVPRLIVPHGFSLLTFGGDKQKDHYVYTVDAWAPGQRSHTLQYGTCGTLDELQEVLQAQWEHQDGGPKLGIRAALIDSGHFPKGVGEFVKQCRRMRIPISICKGSSTRIGSVFRLSEQGPNTATPGMVLVIVDTNETEDWMEGVLHTLKPEDDGGTSLYYDSVTAHEDFLAQLLNDAPVDKLDSHNNVVVSWDRIDTGIPNDFRDCKRYGFAAMMLATNSKPIVPREKQVWIASNPVPQQPRKQFRTPSGMPYLVTERR